MNNRLNSETYMGLAPEDKDLSHHPEELSGVGVRLFQPPRPGVEEKQKSRTN